MILRLHWVVSRLLFRADLKRSLQRLCHYLLYWVERCLIRHQRERQVQRLFGSAPSQLRWSHLRPMAEAAPHYLLRVCLQTYRPRLRFYRFHRLLRRGTAVVPLRSGFQDKARMPAASCWRFLR
jgi:hypothetical protein